MSEYGNETTTYESPDGDILPYADIEEPVVAETAPVLSDEFIIARSIIEDGIAKSKEHGYADLKVEFWVPDDKKPNGGFETRMSLGEYFGGNALRRMVTAQEFDELQAQYLHEAVTYSETHARKVGSVATATERPVYESGQKRYLDAQSAAAGDSLDD